MGHLLQTIRAVLGNELGTRGVVTLLVKASIGWGLRELVHLLVEWVS